MTHRVSAGPRTGSARSQWLTVLLVLAGVLVMLYPVASTLLNNYGAMKAVEDYSKLEMDTPQEQLDEQWSAAHEYNQEPAAGPILDPWLNEIQPTDKNYAHYLEQLNQHPAMGRLVIPSIDSDLPIYHGTEEEVLQKGVGHLYGSSLPVGGEGSHSVLTAHTGLPNATLFDNLNKVKKGEAFYISVAGHRLKYEVDDIQVVLPHEVESLQPVEGKDYITLVTCTPYGINTHRLLVRGHQVPLDEEDNEVFDNVHSSVWQWWMYLLVLAAVIAIALLLRWLWKNSRANRRALENVSDEDES